MHRFVYQLKNRTTGEVIDLGSTAELPEEERVKHGITLENWAERFELTFKKVSDEVK